MQESRRDKRSGSAAVALIVVLIILDLIIVGLVLSSSRDHNLTLMRVETIQAFYAAEAGMNMSIKELMEDNDHDTDGVIGTISDDSNDATDPDIGAGQVVVFSTADTPLVGQTTLTSRGRTGNARRDLQGVLE